MAHVDAIQTTFGDVPRYCYAARLVTQSDMSQGWDNEHDFRGQPMGYFCSRCLLQLSNRDAIAFYAAVYKDWPEVGEAR